MNSNTVKKQWVLRDAECDARVVNQIIDKFGVSEVTASLVHSRVGDDIEAISDFILCDASRPNDPRLLKDMDKAVAEF
mgnify:CR=1 FL=1